MSDGLGVVLRIVRRIRGAIESDKRCSYDSETVLLDSGGSLKHIYRAFSIWISKSGLDVLGKIFAAFLTRVGCLKVTTGILEYVRA